MPNLNEHDCQLPNENASGFARLPPHACFRVKLARSFQKLVVPNPNAAICKRSFRNRSQIYAERRNHARGRFAYIIHPYSDLECYREILFVLLGVWKVVRVPLNVSFGFTLRHKKDFVQVDDFQFAHIIIFVIHILWIISCFFSGYKENNKSIQVNHWKVVKRYLRTYFIFDLMSVYFPYENLQYQDWIHWINLAIIIRYFTLTGFLRRLLQDLRVHPDVTTCLLLVIVTLSWIHFLACIFYVMPFLFYTQKEFKYSHLWLVKSGLYPNAKGFQVYFACVSIIQTHFWGMGESPLSVDDVLERSVLILVMVLGRLWSLFLMATLLRLFTARSQSESKYEEYLLQLKTFIAQKELPEELEARLLEYYHYKYQLHYFNEKNILTSISTYLRSEVLLFGARNVVNKVKMFKAFPRSIIALIIAKCKILLFMNHDIIAKAGDRVHYLYFISSGTTAMFSKLGVEINHLHDGDEIGVSSVLPSGKDHYLYTHIAIESTEIYAISIKDFREIINNDDDILNYFTKRVEERVEEYQKIFSKATAQGIDLMSELRHGKILEYPRVRTQYFEG